MNLTTSNIENRLMLGHCCYADYAIKYLEKQNIGDLQQASCYMNKMRQLYFSMEALNQFTPSAELAPSWTYILTSYPSSFTGTRALYVGGVQISNVLTFVASTRAQQAVIIANDINLYQSDYEVMITPTTFNITSVLSGTTNNGLEVTASTDGGTPVSVGVLSGGLNQWCLDDTKAELILENIDELCGCPCGDCDGSILDDTLPRYVN